MILPTYTTELMKLSRAELQVIMGLLTGLCRYKYYLYLMEKSADEICRRCGSEAEITVCLRAIYMGKPVLDKALKKVVRFINAIGDLLGFT